ncbi:MAG: permease-like cell division protein FtsX [Paludibacteraceae bacterium]|nr:permease-like cell division protein FtsX [Paludibacteraceae bacterium]MBQ9295617.1 permease-like cell division protein FtsX [Paludibacteraceae bacterium]
MRKHRFRNSYLTAAVSVSLVLCMIGLECVLLLSAGALVTRMRENMTITAVLTQDADSVQCAHLEQILKNSSSCSSFTFVSKEEALNEHITSLGEDPSLFVGYNPLSASYEIHPTDLYSNPDSLAVLAGHLQEQPYVAEVIYPRDLADLMNSNVHEFSLILLVVALALLLVSMVLIVNTIRLQIYSKRFLINTMTLVGATSWMTRRPFVLRNMLMGLLSGIAALAILSGMVYYVEFKLGLLLFPLTWQNIAFVSVVVLCSGLLITLVASLIATGRYIRMDNNSLYEI